MGETLGRRFHKIQRRQGIQRDNPGCVLGTRPLGKTGGLCPLDNQDAFPAPLGCTRSLPRPGQRPLPPTRPACFFLLCVPAPTHAGRSLRLPLPRPGS